MPLDVLQKMREEKKKLSDSGENPELWNSLNRIQEKASESSEALSVLRGIMEGLTSNGKALESCLGRVVSDFGLYESIAAGGPRNVPDCSARLRSGGTQGAGIAFPVQKLARGGRISGTSRTGDRNLVRVNAGEWVFTEKQMDRLARITGSRSHAEVFRMAGGAPGRKEFDAAGIRKFSRGGTVADSISSARETLLRRSEKPGTRRSSRLDIGDAVKSLDKLNAALDRLGKRDFDRLGIDSTLDGIFQRISRGTTKVAADIQNLIRTISSDVEAQTSAAQAVRSQADANRAAVREARQAADAISSIDFSGFSGDAFRDPLSLMRKEIAGFAREMQTACGSARGDMQQISQIAADAANSFEKINVAKLVEGFATMDEFVEAALGRFESMKAVLDGSSGPICRTGLNEAAAGKPGVRDRVNSTVGFAANISSLLTPLADQGTTTSFRTVVESSAGAKVGLGAAGAGGRGGAVGMAAAAGSSNKVVASFNQVSKGAGKAALAFAAVGAAVDLAAQGLEMLAEYFASQARIKEGRKELEARQVYEETGFNIRETDFSIDMDKVNARALQYAAAGVAIGGTVGALAGGAAGFAAGGVTAVPGAAVGALKGGALGGAVGYALGAEAEIEKQLGEKKDNPLLKKLDGTYNIELLKSLEQTNANVQAIRELNKQSLGEKRRSERFTQSNNRVIDDVRGGKYSKFHDQRTAVAQNNLETMSVMGGSASQYGAEVSSILDNAASSYVKNSEILDRQRTEVLKKEGVSAEARISATRALLTQQAEVTRKFVASVQNSIGNYEKIPEIIQSRIKTDMASRSLDMNTKNLSATSGMATTILGDNLAESRKAVGVAVKGYLKELPKAQEALNATQKQVDAARERYTQSQGEFAPLGLKELFDEKGNLNGENLEYNNSVINREKKNLDETIEKETGFSNYSQTAFRVDQLKEGNKTWNELDKQLSGLSEENFKINAKDILTQWNEAATADVQNLRATIADPEVDEKIKAKAQQSLEGAEAVQQQLAQLAEQEASGKSPMTRDQLKAVRGIGGQSQLAASEFELARKKVENSPEIKQRSDRLGKAIAGTEDVSTAGNNYETARLALDEKMQKGLFEPLKRMQDAAAQLVSSLDNDPTIMYYRGLLGNLEAQKGYLLQANQYGKYVTEQLDLQNREMEAQRNALKERKEELEKQKKDFETQADTLEEKIDSPEVKAFVKKGRELAEARANAVQKPTQGNLEKVRKLEEKVDSQLKELKNKPGYQQALTLVSVLTGMNASELEIKKAENKVMSSPAELFQGMLNSIGEHKNQLGYLAATSAQERIQAQTSLAASDLDIDQVSRLADERRAASTRQRDLDLDGLWTKFSNDITALEQQLAKGGNVGSIEQEKQVLTDKYNAGKAEVELACKQAQVAAAKTEYDLKMKIVGLGQREVDIQLDFAQTIGAPMETIVALEQKRVQAVRDELAIAEEQYENLKKSGADATSIEEAKLRMQEAQAKAIKSSLGAQRSMIEKVFGNMIGSFSQVAGIMGPGNAAGKYGMGYMQGSDGSVQKGGAPSGGYRSRLSRNVFFSTDGKASVTAAAALKPGEKIDPKPGEKAGKPSEPAEIDRGASGRTKNDSEFSTLGESFANEKAGIETAVFWEKKIYNLLYDTFAASSSASDLKQPVEAAASKTSEAVSAKSLPVPLRWLTPITPGRLGGMPGNDPAFVFQPEISGGAPELQAPNRLAAFPSVAALVRPGVTEVGEVLPVGPRIAAPGLAPASGVSGEAGGDRLTVEVQVKFNHNMFEQEVERIVTTPSRARQIVSGGMA